jgi:hypothetical protein
MLAVNQWDWEWIGMVGAIAASTNTPAMLASLLVVLAAAILLLHTLIWPIVVRPVYAAQRHGLITQRKALCALGIVMIGAAFPGFGVFLKDLGEAVGLL